MLLRLTVFQSSLHGSRDTATKIVAQKSEQDTSLIFTSVCRSVSESVVAEVKHFKLCCSAKIYQDLSWNRFKLCTPLRKLSSQNNGDDLSVMLNVYVFLHNYPQQVYIFLCRCNIADCTIFYCGTYCATLMVYTYKYSICVCILCVLQKGSYQNVTYM